MAAVWPRLPRTWTPRTRGPAAARPVELHEEMVLRRAAERRSRVLRVIHPLHGARATDPDLVRRGNPEAPWDQDVGPRIEQLPFHVEDLDADVVAIGDIDAVL